LIIYINILNLDYFNLENKNLRISTAQKRKELEQRQKEREKLKAKKLSTNNSGPDSGELRRLTQEELLAEAKITEELNLASLG
jgi:vacuolar protein sorting-associated protein 72